MTSLTIRARRDDALSRQRIIDAAIELLDAGGAAGLTFRTLSEKLATGPGAIYGHIANKGDLLAAACDAVVIRTVDVADLAGAPQAVIRAVALALFDAIDAHPWVGSVIGWAAGQTGMVRILECLGQQLRRLQVPQAAQWATVSALLNYILGVGGQNASNAQSARARGARRDEVLGAVALAWSQLDAAAYPFVRDVAGHMREHDDRADFLVGIDLLLAGIAPAQ